MKVFRRFCALVLLVAGLLGIGLNAGAQGFGLSVTPSASAVLVSNSVTYTISVTNYSPNGDVIPNATLTNILPASVQIVSATPSPQGTVSNYNNTVVFYLGTFVYGPVGAQQMTLTVMPKTAGFFTNAVMISYFTNSVSTNVVVQATNVPPTLADIGVTIAGSAQPVVTNDLTAYTISVTNAGPAAAPGVTLTNRLPGGVLLRGASRTYTVSGSNLLFNLGTLAVGALTNVQINIQPTNVTTLPLIASVGASGVLDTNTANNVVTNNLAVISYLPGDLKAVTNSAQTINVQNGWLEQTILLSNQGTNDVDAVRLVVTGLTNRLVNAVGTNSGSPFVYYSAVLPAGQSATLRLQYSPRVFFPLTNEQLHAYAVPMPDWSPPAALSTSTNVNISRIVPLSDGSMMIEFPSTLGKTYTVVYSDNISFSNAMMAPPSIVAPANRVQWIDYGPPTTTSEVPNSSARFYRVFQNP